MTTRRVTEKEMAAVLRLDGPQRFQRFVKVVVDAEEAWGLWDDGWASYADEEDKPILPLWPAREYASACAVEDWASFQPKSVPLSELLDEVAPTMDKNDIRAGVFPTPGGRGVVTAWDDLEAALREEMERYS